MGLKITVLGDRGTGMSRTCLGRKGVVLEERGQLCLGETNRYVFSDSTERYDRGAKFASYRSIPTLEDYLLVSQTAVQVEHYHRRPDGTWIFRVLGPRQVLELSSLSCSLSVEAVYAKVFSLPEDVLQAAPRTSGGTNGDG